MAEPSRIVSRVDIAARLGLSYHQLTRVWPAWQATRGFPTAVPGYSKRYDWEAIQAWLIMVRPPELGGGPVASSLPTAAGEGVDYSARLAASAERLARAS